MIRGRPGLGRRFAHRDLGQGLPSRVPHGPADGVSRSHGRWEVAADRTPGRIGPVGVAGRDGTEGLAGPGPIGRGRLKSRIGRRNLAAFSLARPPVGPSPASLSARPRCIRFGMKSATQDVTLRAAPVRVQFPSAHSPGDEGSPGGLGARLAGLRRGCPADGLSEGISDIGGRPTRRLRRSEKPPTAPPRHRAPARVCESRHRPKGRAATPPRPAPT